MTDKPTSNDPEEDLADPAALARRFADLWQEQLTAMAADPAMARACADSLQVWQTMAQQMGLPQQGASPAGMQAQGTHGQDPTAMMQTWAGMLGQMMGAAAPQQENRAKGAGDGTATGTRTADGSAAASGASGGGEQLLRDVLLRLDAIERRLDGLEPGAGRTGGTAGAGPDAKRGGKGAGKRGTGKRAPGRK
ncbi:MAG: hypothetical protein RIM33_08640 [Alphaproteobacteria bacterium]